MANMKARGGANTITIQAVVTRADGRVENLGTISYWSRNPIKRFWFGGIVWLRAQRRLLLERLKARFTLRRN